MSASDIPTLTYFDIRGLAELPRLLLAAGDVKYVDDRIPFSKKEDGSYDRGNWEERKLSLPYHQAPVFTVGGVMIPQSSAIIRYISKKYHLDGDNEIEAALVDAAYEAVLDIRKGFFTARGDAAKTAEFWSKSFPAQLATLSNNVQGSSSSVWFTGKKMTYADVAIYYTLWVLSTENKEAVEAGFAANPKLKAIFDAVEKDPKVAAYLAQRKVTPM